MDIVKDKKALRRPVESIELAPKEELLKLMLDIKSAYDERPGCQLMAAKQIGSPLDLALVKRGRELSMFITDISIKKNGSFKTSSEGSYSLIGRYHVKRSTAITASYTVLEPNEDFTSFKTRHIFDEHITDIKVARIFQHLVDFNNGKLLCDTGKMYALVDKAQKGHFEDW